MATSQASAWVDFVTSFVVFAWIGLSGGNAAAAGAIAGGIVNCTLNYKWTFRGSHCPVANVVFLTEFCLASETLDSWGISRNLRFTIARLAVSFLVSVFWNLLLQRTFVYRYVKFDTVLSVITRAR